MLSMSVICTICCGKVFCSNNLNTQIYRKDNDTCTLNACKIQNVQNNSGDNNMNAENVDNHSDIEWKFVNGWWHYGPFEVFVGNVSIQDVEKDLNEMYKRYSELANTEYEDGQYGKIIIDVRELTKTRTHKKPKNESGEFSNGSLASHNCGNEEYSSQSVEPKSDYSNFNNIANIHLYINDIYENDVPPTIDILNKVIDAVKKTSGHDWIYSHPHIELYLCSHNIINNQVFDYKYNLEYYTAVLSLCNYLESITLIVSNSKIMDHIH